ncbi:single-stranded DNA-binding protein [Nocardioides sp.]|uniref:single-stranded DNA-binding protein n=1 Tax=Nocardioides sp. TaxID=35761 RepID=UPI0039E653EC
MNDTIITVQGYVGGTVQFRQAGTTDLATFRLGCTPRHFHRRTGEWADAPTQWYTVNAWRGLARNVAESLVKGDAVGVHGRLNVSTWTDQSGQVHTTNEIEAIFVGHDLNRGVTRLRRNERPATEDTAARQANPWEVAAPTDAVMTPEEDPDAESDTGGAEGATDPLTGWREEPAA